MTKLEGAALEKRRRAIAANAVFEDRRANGVHDRPMTDHEAGIQEMIFTLLTKLAATDKAKAYEEMMQGKPVPANAAPASEAVKSLANQHMELARSIGVQGTPTFFINGAMVVGADMPKIEGLLRDWAKGRKLYGHLFDDVLAVKYLHQRYTNYLRWLQWKG